MRELYLFDNEWHLVAELVTSIGQGQRVFIACNSKARAKRLAAALQKGFPHLKMILVTSETIRDGHVQEFCEAVSSEILQYDVTVSSPSLGTGVDISFPGGAREIHAVYGFFDVHTMHTDIAQHLGRVRNPRALKVWISRRLVSSEDDPDVVRDELGRSQVVPSAFVGKSDSGEVIYRKDHLLLELLTTIESRRRSSLNDLVRNFCDHMVKNGWSVIAVPKDEKLAKRGGRIQKASRALIEKQVVDAVLKSKVLEDAALKALRRKKDREPLRPDDQAALDRTEFENAFRLAPSREMLLANKDGRLKDRASLFHVVKVSGATKVHGKTKGGDLVRVALLRSGLLDGHQFRPDVCIGSEDLDPFIGFCGHYKALFREVLGVEIRQDARAKPVAQLNEILKCIGLRVEEASRKKVGGSSVRTYSLDPERLDMMETLARGLMSKYQQG